MASLIPQRVKNTGIDLLIAGVVIGVGIVGLSYINKKFNLTGRFISGGSTIGSSIGGSIGGLIGSIPTGFAGGFTQASTQGAASLAGIGVAGADAVRRALGLRPDPTGSTYYPFTDIPINPGSQTTATSSSAGAGSPPTNPTYSTPSGSPISYFSGYLSGLFGGLPAYQQRAIATGDSTQGFGLSARLQAIAQSIQANPIYFRQAGLVRA